MGVTPQPKMLPPLEKYLQATKASFNACLDTLDKTLVIDGFQFTLRFHYVKFDRSNEPVFAQLARMLVRHITRYALSARARESIRDSQSDPADGSEFLAARDMFRIEPTSGEIGELLLFFLLESVYEAPQILCKMGLKTNAKDEVKGSDGIHVRWNNELNGLDFIIGESKLHQSLSGALTDAFESIRTFHDEKRLQLELDLVGSHFKFLDDNFREALMNLLDADSFPSSCRVFHAGLIGWDWAAYSRILSNRALAESTLKTEYAKYATNIHKLCEDRLTPFPYNHLTFEFLFLPFRSVQEFRAEFYRVLTGRD